MSKGEILLLGDINIDTVWPVSEFPVPGRDGLVKTLTVEIGGAVVNSAIILDNLDQKVALLGSTGSDLWAEYAMRELAQTKINLIHLKLKSNSTTGLTFIIDTPDGERTMFSNRGANTQLEARDIEEDAFKNASILHISGYALLESPQKDAVWRAVELATKNNVKICLDTGLEPVIQKPKELRRLLPLLSICISGLQEAEVLLNCDSPEEAADALVSMGIQLAAIKLGKNGCLLADGKQQCLFPAFPVKAVDSTGAGDSFTAGLLFSWMRGLSLPAAATLANALGALATMVYGAGCALPQRNRVLEFLHSMQKHTAANAFHKNLKEVIKVLEVG